MLELTPTHHIANHQTPAKHTVRKLTHLEKLKRAGVLEPHQYAACEWYADAHALGFDTISCTANYEGGGGGGGFGAFDLCARYKHQMEARENYAWARAFVPAVYRALFEEIVINQVAVAGVARTAFNHKRSQAESKTRAALRLCADYLHDGIKALLPIEYGSAPARPTQPRAPTLAENAIVQPAARYKPVTDAIDVALDEAMLTGKDVAEIHIAPRTAEALHREGGHEETFRGVPLVIRERWGWGHLLVPPTAPPVAAEAAA